MNKLSLIIIFTAAVITAQAQKIGRGALDTTKPQNVTVTSSYKPVLREAAKINFTAANAPADTARPKLFYTIPSQNLFFTYDPSPLKPLALSIDSFIAWQNHNYLKVGYGNFATPFVQGGVAFGDGSKTVVNIHARHTGSKGKLPYQQFTKTNVEGIGIFTSNNNINEFTAKAWYDADNQYLYGYRPDTLKITKDSLKQRFNSFGARIGLRNKNAEQVGFSYTPSLQINNFNDNHDGHETTLKVNLAGSKNFGRMYGISLAFNADLTNFKTNDYKIKNNLVYVEPTLYFKTPNLKITAGVTPSWDNSNYKMLPNFVAEAKIKNEKFIAMAGYQGYFNKTSYQSLATYNPYIAQPTELRTTTIKEAFAGFKGSAGNHFTYNGRLSLLQQTNMPLFVNDTLTGRYFNILNETKLRTIAVHGELGYTVQDKFSLLAGTTLRSFQNLDIFDKAYGLIPMEITAALRWQVLKDVHFKADAFIWDGPRYRTKSGDTQKQKAAIDINTGVEVGIIKNWSVWLQFNNLLNNKYQRWNQYEVLGFNLLGGVVYTFGK